MKTENGGANLPWYRAKRKGTRGVGRCRREEEAKLVFMQKKAGKLLRQEGSDCIFAADSPSFRRTSAQQTLVRVR